MNPVRRLLGAFDDHPDAANAALAVGLSVVLVANAALGGLVDTDEGDPFDAVAYALMAITPLPLAVRHRRPVLALGLTSIAVVATFVLGYHPQPSPVAVLVALYTVALTGERRRSLWIGAVAAAAVAIAGIAFEDDDRNDTAAVATVGAVAAPLAAGDAVRHRRESVAQIEARAVEAELTRDAEARRQVQEERLRIARDLHDVLAHGIATINVQSGVAAHVLDERPEVARDALVEIKGASRVALNELRAMLQVLRSDDVDDPVRRPAPGLGDLVALADSVRRSGVALDMRVADVSTQIDPAVELAAYRIVQESLTNVLRHAPGADVAIAVSAGPEELEVEIVDHGSSTRIGSGSDEGSGTGLLGLRERAESLGGTLVAGPTLDGGFRVHGRLPLETAG
ncbi:MAG: sensor histidine kinase [Actinomycetota bacterium]